MKLLHLASDEKFIRSAIAIFDCAFPGRNAFVIVKAPANPPLKHVDEGPAVICHVQHPGTVGELTELARQYDIVFLHGLDAVKLKVFHQLKETRKFVWLVWGAEVYNGELLGETFVQRKTTEMIRDLGRVGLVERLKGIYRSLSYGKMETAAPDELRSAILEMPAVGILHREEYDFFVAKGLISPGAKYLPFTYYPLEYIFNDISIGPVGDNILVGNSATSTGNHFEVIEMLSSLDLGARKVIVPLSYGDRSYAQKVVVFGKRLLSDKFLPVLEFQSLQAYNKLLTSCGFVLMNMNRQQAVGNILTSLYLGSKVFLNDTTIFQYLTNLGCEVFRMDSFNSESLSPLSPQNVLRNQEILRSEISLSNVISSLQKSVREYVSNEN